MKNGNKIRVLVVDDSKYMRYVISKILREDGGIEVVGEARDGMDGLEKILELKPDVVTMDVEMPRMDGLQTLQKVMEKCPVPVLMLSKYTESGGDTAIRALEAGAVDCLLKPDGRESLTLNKVKSDLVQKIRMAASLDIKSLKGNQNVDERGRIARVKGGFSSGEMRKVIVIGSSTGGPRALHEVVSNLPAGLPIGCLIVQHMPPGFTKSLADRLNEISAYSVTEATQGDRLEPGRILVAPGDCHMRVGKGGFVRMSKGDPVNSVRPAADLTLEDAAAEFGSKVVGIILTGMGKDGTLGGAMVKAKGGLTIAQEGSTCTVNGMPDSLIKSGHADLVIPLKGIALKIAELARS